MNFWIHIVILHNLIILCIFYLNFNFYGNKINSTLKFYFACFKIITDSWKQIIYKKPNPTDTIPHNFKSAGFGIIGKK